MKLMTNNLRLLIALIGLVFCFSSMQAQDDLQEYINKNSSQKAGARRAPDDVTVVDLSQFSAVNRTTTLNVANGMNFRFINGTLTRAESLDGPIMHVGGGSWVGIGDGAKIDASGSPSRAEAIFMDGGELLIEKGGCVQGHKYTSSDLNNFNPSNPYAAVLMTSNSDVFNMESGSTVFNTIVCNAPNATVNYSGGTMTQDAHLDNFMSAADINLLGGYPDSGFQICLTRKENVIVAPSRYDWLCNLSITAPKKGEQDVLVKNCHPYFLKNEPSLWIERVKWEGDSKYQLYADYGDNTIKLSFDDLQDFIDSWPREQDPEHPEWWHCGCVKPGGIIDPFPLIVPCKGVKVKKPVEFPDDDLQWLIDGRPQEYEETYECEGEIDQGEHDVYIRPNSTLCWRWIRWHGCGCQGKHIWVWGTLHIYKAWFYYYWRFIHLMPGGKIIIEDLNGECEETIFHIEGGEIDFSGGKCSGGKYGWYCTGGTIYIRGGWLSGGTCGGWTGNGGKSYHYGGTIHAGIHNYCWHYWYGGYCTGGGSYTIYNYKGGHFYYYGGTCGDGGTGKIWNEGDLYIDGGGSVSCGDIYCVRGGCVYIISKLTFTLRLVFTEENIVPGATIVVGGEGYTLTQEDISKLQIVLPEGYEWRYDRSCGCISIYQTAGISGVVSDQPTITKSYDAAGRQVGEGSKGLNIQQMSDGTVRKVTTK